MKRHNTRGLCSAHHRQRERGRELRPLQPKVPGGTRCTGPGCSKTATSRGLCPGHRQQREKGYELSPLRNRVPSLTRDDQGRKQCRRCGCWLPEDRFTRNASSKDGLDGSCISCRRSDKTLTAYNITSEQYEAMLAAQGGGCAICGGQNESGRSLAVDHDHSCCDQRTSSCGRCVRGLLCDNCNTGIGLMQDSAQRLQDAARYLSGFDQA